jgi:LCP family protein required for cell wall assembly
MGCCLGVVIATLLNALFLCLGLTVYVAAPPETTNILILGSDVRADSAEEAIARTDSIMVLSVNPRQQQVSLFSLPRDVFIESPTYGYLRANTVLRNAELSQPGTGVSEMMTAMEYTFGIELDHYIRLDFEGFIEVVDALGGVEVDIPKAIVDRTYPTSDYGTMIIEFSAGQQTLDGEQALIYARTRHGDDDYQRAERQQQVIQAIFYRLANPLRLYRWPGVVAAVNRNIETDMNGLQLLTLAPGILLYGRSSAQIERLVLTRDYIVRGANGEAFPNVEALRPWFDSHMQ